MNKRKQPEHCPLISVVMPVYNAATTLGESIQSILNQTIRDFEVLVVNDGSTDGSLQVLESFRHPHLQIHSFPQNVGLIEALNFGLRKSRGTYIARMDADDVSRSDRFEKLTDYLDSHPGVGICGTWARTFGKRKTRLWKFPTDHESIRALMLFQSPLIHPSVFMRRKVLLEYGLDYRLENAEDYDLWIRAADHTRIENLPQVLLDYRVHKASFTSTRTRDQHRRALSSIYKRLLERLFEETKPIPLDLHYAMAQRQKGLQEDQLAEAADWFDRIRAANATRRVYSEKTLNPILIRFYLENLCKSQASLRFIRGAFRFPILSACNLRDRLRTYLKRVFRKFN